MHIYKQDYGILTTAHLLFKHFQFSNFRAKQARKLTPQCLERRWLNLPKLVDAMAPEFHSAMLLNVLLNYVNPLVAVDRLRGDDLVNGTAAQPQANTNSSSHSVHLKLPPGKDNVEVNNISSTEVVLSHNKNRGVGGGGGGAVEVVAVLVGVGDGVEEVEVEVDGINGDAVGKSQAKEEEEMKATVGEMKRIGRGFSTRRIIG
ncbi:hypothetical protein V6N13_120236 [Hibiscus sabdariffa]